MALRAHPHELRQHVVRQLHARAARLLEQVQRGAPGGRAAALPVQLELRVRHRLPRQLCGLDGLRAARGRVCRGRGARLSSGGARPPARAASESVRVRAGAQAARVWASMLMQLCQRRPAPGGGCASGGRRRLAASRTAVDALPSGAQRRPHAGPACAPACAAGAAPCAASSACSACAAPCAASSACSAGAAPCATSSACAPACAAGAAPGAASSPSVFAAPRLASRLRARGGRAHSPAGRASIHVGAGAARRAHARGAAG